MNKFVILDRDGTINVDKGYVYRWADFEYCENAVEAMKMLNDLGFKIIIITNQSGVARGFYSELELIQLHEKLIKDLEKKHIQIEKIYYCPHLKGSEIEKYNIDCKCRKPKIGMFEKAIKDFSISTSDLFIIGDNERDLSYSLLNDSTGILLAKNKRMTKNFIVKKDLFDAVLYIKKLQLDFFDK